MKVTHVDGMDGVFSCEGDVTYVLSCLFAEEFSALGRDFKKIVESKIEPPPPSPAGSTVTDRVCAFRDHYVNNKNLGLLTHGMGPMVFGTVISALAEYMHHGQTSVVAPAQSTTEDRRAAAPALEADKPAEPCTTSAEEGNGAASQEASLPTSARGASGTDDNLTPVPRVAQAQVALVMPDGSVGRKEIKSELVYQDSQGFIGFEYGRAGASSQPQNVVPDDDDDVIVINDDSASPEEVEVDSGNEFVPPVKKNVKTTARKHFGQAPVNPFLKAGQEVPAASNSNPAAGKVPGGPGVPKRKATAPTAEGGRKRQKTAPSGGVTNVYLSLPEGVTLAQVLPGASFGQPPVSQPPSSAALQVKTEPVSPVAKPVPEEKPKKKKAAKKKREKPEKPAEPKEKEKLLDLDPEWAKRFGDSFFS